MTVKLEKEETKYDLVVVAKEDIDPDQTLEGQSDTYCGLCALTAIQAELMHPEVVKEVIHSIERMTKEEVKRKNVFYYYDDRCTEFGCDNPADYIVTIWYKKE